VAVLGAAGGLGAAYVQLCLAAGARVIAVVGGPGKVAFVEDLGAEGVDHLDPGTDVVTAVSELTGGRGVDVIIDPVQGTSGATLRQVLVPDGRHVLCGHAGGLEPHDPHFYVRNHTLVGATLGGYPPEHMAALYAEADAHVRGLLDAGTYRPTVTRSIAFEDVPDALIDMVERRTMGRVVVRVT
jgi:NADPH2:quinone reductase